MAETGRGMLFRKRNILGVALVAGIGLGVYLGQFKGFGLGGGSQMGIGIGDGEPQVTVESSDTTTKPLELTQEQEPSLVPDVIRVLIDDREFLLRSASKGGMDVPVTLPKLIQLIQDAPGDADGIRVRVSMKTKARASAEENLKKELEAAGIDDAAVLWIPTPVK
jgi:hypothetical protein